MSIANQSFVGTSLSGGRYAITAKLGEGGMGAVYRALDNNLGADVVIKLPHRTMVADPEFSRRFREEVRSLIRLSHPHIVKVTDLGDWDGLPFAVLQFLPGGSLEDRLAAWRGPAALAALGNWLDPVGAALDYVHSQKMVHRDVKPGNILFDAQGHAFLGDFGVVKVLAAAEDDRSGRTAMTGTGMVLGTPHYMAPELIMGEPFDGRVDQYALAITAYELVCGRRPFEHEVSTRVLMMHARDEPPRPLELCPWVPPGLDEVLLKGLAKNPKDRYPSCAEFAAAAVAAAGCGRGAQAGRARVRCESCGQTLTISVETLAKLSRTGRSAPCPKCKGPLDLTAGTATVLPPSPSGERPRSGTAVLDVHGSTFELRALDPQAATPPPAAPAGGTMVLGGGRQSPPGGLPVAGGTVAEPRPRLAAAGDDGPGRTIPPWAPVAGAAAVVALVAVAAAVLWPRSEGTRPPAPGAAAGSAVAGAAAPAPTAAAAPAVVVARNDAPRPGLGPQPAAPEPSPLPPAPPTPARTPEPEGGFGSATGPTRGEIGPGEPPGLASVSRASPGLVRPPAREPDRVPDSEMPTERNLPLARLLATPQAYAGKLVTLEQVYCVARNPWRTPDGSLRVALVESRIELLAKSARVDLGKTFELGLDRRLADQLLSLGLMNGISDAPQPPSWLMRPANLTVKVDDSSPRIVRLELFKNFKTEVRGGSTKILVVLFETQTVTPSGETSGFGNPDEWQKVKKLGHAYNQYQRFFKGMQSQMSLLKWNAFNSQMNQMIASETARSAAAAAATQRAVQQRMMPR